MPFTVPYNGNGNDGGAVPPGPLSADSITAHHACACDAGCRPTGRSQARHRHREQGQRQNSGSSRGDSPG
jgi:hypothetical protein